MSRTARIYTTGNSQIVILPGSVVSRAMRYLCTAIRRRVMSSYRGSRILGMGCWSFRGWPMCPTTL